MGEPSSKLNFSRMWLLCVCLLGGAACEDDAAPGDSTDTAAASDAATAATVDRDAAVASDAGTARDASAADASTPESAESPEREWRMDNDDAGKPAPTSTQPRYRADITPVTSVDQALPGTFIPPYEDCRAPKDGEPAGMGADGKVCTHVMISGCTEPGRYFPDYASCDIVRTQRPFWEAPPASVPREDDPRLNDAAFMTELSWMTEQVAASGCTCCHDSRVGDGKVGQWDIHRGPIWLDTLSDTGLALFVGLADSSALGAYPAADNHGFDRDKTGIPTTDTARMQAFLRAEMERRGITEEEARAVPPFGGPIYANRIMESVACAGQGIDPASQVVLGDAQARYVYVQEEAAQNPGVPPNGDLPEGTLWRLDVLASAAALKGPIPYGTTPEGSFQALPEATSAPQLESGKRYKLYALKDVGVPVANCIFTFGEPIAPKAETMQPTQPAADAGAPVACAAEAASCTDNAGCSCAEANYCALMPGQTQGYCTATGCKDDPSVCPSGWSCFDLGAFGPDLPSICMKP
jgi:hypothetical protein